MKIAVLTTETPHHTYFVKALKEIFSDITVFCETKNNTPPPFKTEHSFEVKRDIYECQRWFGKEQIKISEITSVKRIDFLIQARYFVKNEPTCNQNILRNSCVNSWE